MRLCRTCSKELYRRNKSGLCRSCIAVDPEAQAKRVEASKRAFMLRPELGVAAGDRLRAQTKTPEHAERARRMMIEGRLWERGVAAKGGPGSEIYRRTGVAVSNTRLAHIPPELRTDYRRLVYTKGFSAAEATALIAEQHEMHMARWRKQIGAAAPKRVKVQSVAVAPVVAPEPEPFAPVPIRAHMTLFDRAMAHTSNETKVPRALMLSRDRTRQTVRARWIVANVLREAGRSLPLIARMLKLKDHSTILHGMRETPNIAQHDPEFARALAAVMQSCRPFIASATGSKFDQAA